MSISGDVGLALLITAIAGLSTGMGSIITFLIKKPKVGYLSFSLGFSAGVMLYVSFMELLPQALEQIGQVIGVTAFFLGILFIGLIDILIPEKENPHSYIGLSERLGGKTDNKLMRTGLFTMLAITIHNFPEGLITFGAALSDLRFGVVVAIAIAIHNIPEGISISIPISYAGVNKKKVVMYSFLSGLAEPLGAIFGFLVLLPFLSTNILSSLFGFVAGVMVYISIDELLPIAHQYGHGHTVIMGVIMGMFVMAFSLLIF